MTEEAAEVIIVLILLVPYGQLAGFAKRRIASHLLT